MKKIIAWLLVIALTAAVSIGATLAYLTDTDEDVNVMTLGKVKIDQLEYERVDDETANEEAAVQEFHDNKPLLPAVTEDGFAYTPGDTNVDWTQIGKDGYTSDIWDPTKINNEIDKMVFVKNKGDYDAYVRSVIAFESNGYTANEFKNLFHLNLNVTDWTWSWVETPVSIPGEEGTTNYVVAVATYNKVLEPGKLTEISLSQIALDSIADNADIEGFGDTYQILVKSQAIQADGFDDPMTALDEGFGVITVGNIPWETDTPVKGIDMKTALHHLEGDTAQVITTKVSSITYGLNAEYPAVVNGYNGTLVDVEQDVPVYAYYVPNGSNYDVYFLADDVIYAPTDSTKLYNGMSALKSLDTHNYDLSRTTTLYAAFQNCTSLTALDVTDWDTSKVTNMTGVFNGCSALKTLEGTENWDLSACATIYAAFQGCKALQSVDVTGWDTSKVTNIQSLFNNCNALTEVTGISQWDVGNVENMKTLFQNCKSLVQLEDLSNWDTGKVTVMDFAFSNCNKLQELGTSNWDTGSVTSMKQVFCWCYELEEIDVSGWDVGNVQNFYGTFYECNTLKNLDVSDWDTGSATDMTFLFTGCSALRELDVSRWDTGNVTAMGATFRRCGELKQLATGNWDLSKVTTTNCMFYECKKLESVDVSNWDTSSVTDMAGMFNHCEVLTTVDVSNWDVSNVWDFSLMFQQCWEMQVLDVSKWDTSSGTNMGWMFYGCRSLPVLDISNFDVSNVTVMSHMFADCNTVKELKVDNWDVSSVQSLDATFNDCDSLTTINVSKWNTGNIREFSQSFESCDSLTEIIGLENWNTSNGRTFDEMFNGSGALKVLNLSSFDTRNVTPGFKNVNGDLCKGFSATFSGVTGLEKLVLGDNFAFDGNGTVQTQYQAKLPAPAAVEGADGKWYNADTGVGYLPSEIPEETAATYVAVKP